MSTWYGLTSAPAVFQALNNDVLGDFLNVFVFTYLKEHKLYVLDRNLATTYKK